MIKAKIEIEAEFPDDAFDHEEGKSTMEEIIECIKIEIDGVYEDTSWFKSIDIRLD